MFTKYAISSAAALACLVLAGSASANVLLITEDELDPAVFPAVAEEIRVGLDGPEAPAGLTLNGKRQVLNSLERMQRYLEDDPVRNRNRVMALQTRVNQALAPAIAQNTGDSEVICRRERKVGTNIPTTVCRTRAEMEAEKQLADETMQRLQQGKAVVD